ncbi:TetR/AcrR family transcriptional regulator [Pseudofrankia sp. BMG5.36]|uniref:TetR/AcrR family transcriptional regulator n=1 Tax=Pseudofrankia sp. BMG5.36 TaxID=1834512 RepID=UPI0008DA324B|nr:TetR/AcrR family transcriptional regulator [Pseudofrankia sp. BMG5.36]OHV42943.1 TetR family transcriptional regulator [Pseudofrankia sp. BMG5.36]
MVVGGAGGAQAAGGPGDSGGHPPRPHSFKNSQRSKQAAATRERIVTAATDIVHDLPNWDWRSLTIRAVAQRAGVNESTVYRHFATERNLRDTVLRRLETEAGVELETLRLDNFGQTIAQTFAYLATFPIDRPPLDDPTFAALDQRRRGALRAALAQSASGWTDSDREMAAAALDAYWSVSTFERMITTWNLDPDEATRAATWVIGLIAAAVREGHSPRRPDTEG